LSKSAHPNVCLRCIWWCHLWSESKQSLFILVDGVKFNIWDVVSAV